MVDTFPQSIRQAAQKHPEHLAFKCGPYGLTYSELNEKTEQLASHLVNAGLSKGARVGVYMNRCIETAIAIYGIMKAGGVYVPLDPTLPLSRIIYLLNDCDIEHLVSIPQLNKKHSALSTHETPLKSIIGSSAVLKIESTSWDGIFSIKPIDLGQLQIKADDMAYIMYTSGSTGYPKGIMHTHFSGLSYAKLSVDLFNLTNSDILANHAPLHFDISTLGYFAGPLAQATTVIVTDAHTKMPASLAKLMEAEKITIWYSVPLALIQMLQSDTLHKLNFVNLRAILFGGEVFTTKYLNKLMNLLPNVDFYNIYGPAEVNQCTSHHVKKALSEGEILPIGTAWQQTTLKVLDKNDHEVVKGEIGELVVDSVTKMKGYWNNEELTKKSEFTEIENGTKRNYFRTGDLVRESKNGELLFVGRNDRQVKIRGYRIEIDEIEACIAQHEEIDEVAVVTVNKSDNLKEIMAVVRLNEKKVVTEKELLAFCKNRLPVYAVPNSIVFMNEFPRTGSGKINRREIEKTYSNL